MDIDRAEAVFEKYRGLKNLRLGGLHLHIGSPVYEIQPYVDAVTKATQLIDRLEADGLVRRVDDPADRRGVRAMLTPLGIERQVAGAKQVDQVQKEVARTLAGVDPATLTRALAAFR